MTDEDGRSDAGEDAAGQTASTDGSAEASIDEPSEAPDQASSEEPETSVATQEEPPAVSVVETAKVEIKTKPRKRSLYGGRHQRRGPGQSAPDDR